MTRAEIEKAADDFCLGRDLPLHARPSFIVWLDHVNSLPIDPICPYCCESLSVTDHLDHGQAWTVFCPCGKSENVARGL
jgi:hypothetical protein